MKCVALVTGGNRGIGFETCRQLGLKGYRVVLTSRDQKLGQRACAELHGEGLDMNYCQMDVTNEQSVLKACQYVEEKFGRLDILVNNAAIAIDGSHSILNLPPETLRRTMDVNMFGPFLVAQAFLPLMRRNEFGRIINVSSGYGSIQEMGARPPAYRASKAALNALTRILAAEVDGENIQVNAMCPGWVRTDMGGLYATRSPLEATDTIVWLANMPDNGPSGGFYRDRELAVW